MRSLILALFHLTLLSCGRSYSALTIPAEQTFVLGEYMSTTYTATLTNRGTQAVEVSLIRKSDGATVSSLTLDPGAEKGLRIPPDQQVEMKNRGKRDATLFVSMSKGVEGMGYKGTSDRQSVEETPPVNTAPERTGPLSDRFRSSVAPGECLVLGEGAWMSYTAKVSVSGSTVGLRVYDHQRLRQVMAFGLGAGSTESVDLGRGDILYLCNETERSLRVKIRLSKKVRGGRIVTDAR